MAKDEWAWDDEDLEDFSEEDMELKDEDLEEDPEDEEEPEDEEDPEDEDPEPEDEEDPEDGDPEPIRVTRPRRENRTKRLFLLTQPSIDRKLRRLAKREGISLNELVNRLFEEYIDKEY